MWKSKYGVGQATNTVQDVFVQVMYQYKHIQEQVEIQNKDTGTNLVIATPTIFASPNFLSWPYPVIQVYPWESSGPMSAGKGYGGIAGQEIKGSRNAQKSRNHLLREGWLTIVKLMQRDELPVIARYCESIQAVNGVTG